MEPSLRSSSYRPTECKLRRTDPALHETIQRFVESLSHDVRVSQYADINYAMKRFENSKWYWLTQSGRSGYLVFLPNTPVVWIDEQFKSSYKIQMRVSSAVYEKTSIMIASLNLGDAVLRLEDVWLMAGQPINTPFTQRWNTLQEFFALQYKSDSVLQQGLRIETAAYQSLESIKDIQHVPNTLLAQGENEKRRLRVQMPNSAPVPVPVQGTKVQGTKPTQVKKPVLNTTRSVQNANEATAVAHPEYPDTYDLFVNGVKKGYAAVQDMDLSKRLRLVKGEIRVKIEWNPEFSMFEIHDIL
jgi:hypothetical protein